MLFTRKKAKEELKNILENLFEEEEEINMLKILKYAEVEDIRDVFYHIENYLSNLQIE